MSEWIPVGRRLPDRSDIVIVAFNNGGVWTSWFYQGKWHDEDQNEFGVTRHGDDLTVTHWMPFPDAPK